MRGIWRQWGRNAPYSLIQTDQKQKIEVRNYDSIILVSSNMAAGGANSALEIYFATFLARMTAAATSP